MFSVNGVGSLSTVTTRKHVKEDFSLMVVCSHCGVEAWPDPSQRGQSVTIVLSGRHLPIRKLYRAPSHKSTNLIVSSLSSTIMIDALLNYVSMIYVDTCGGVNFSNLFCCVSGVKACEIQICMFYDMNSLCVF